VQNYATHVAVLQDLLKVGRKEGKAGSQTRVIFGEAERAAFHTIKKVLLDTLILYSVNPDKPFVLRVDASGKAVGAALEQFVDPQEGMPTSDQVQCMRRVPVAFCSRKLTPSQANSWTPREKETYAIILALTKWASWIGLQPILVLTDHISLENWTTEVLEVLDTPSGPAGRRARWHEILSKFDICVEYVKEKDNTAADALSRWAYPASKAFADVSIHGSEKDDAEMRALIEEEHREERLCHILRVRDLHPIWEKVAIQRVERLKEEEPENPTIGELETQIAGIRAIAKTGGRKAPKPAPQKAKKRRGGLEMFLQSRMGEGANDAGSSPKVEVHPLSKVSVDGEDQMVENHGEGESLPNDVCPPECVEVTVGALEGRTPPPKPPIKPLRPIPPPPPPPKLPGWRLWGKTGLPQEIVGNRGDDQEGLGERGEEAVSSAWEGLDRVPATVPYPLEDPSGRRVLTEDQEGRPRDEILTRSKSKERTDLAGQGVNPLVLPSEGTRPSGPQEEEPPRPVMEGDWTENYRVCPRWGPVLSEIEVGNAWPEGVQYIQTRMYREGILAIPTDLTEKVIRGHHSYAGHPGGERLWEELSRRFVFANDAKAKKFTMAVHKQCEICQVTEPSMGPYHCHIVPTPIPPYLMASVSVDLFSLPEVRHEGKRYDTIGVCVDRQSGWIIAAPFLNKGLTSERVAKEMYKQWDMFGIPTIVTSDRGPHFAGGWWRTLCGKLGVRVAYSQAYHHQANGRAESAGHQIIKKLRQIIAEFGGSWVEALPQAIRHIHDTVGETGLSPYQIVFGRHRPLAAYPLPPLKEAEDAVTFFDRMRSQDLKVAEKLNAAHAKRAVYVNKNRLEPPPLRVGAKVWYRPEPQSGVDKLDTRWKGPGKVMRASGGSFICGRSEGRCAPGGAPLPTSSACGR